MIRAILAKVISWCGLISLAAVLGVALAHHPSAGAQTGGRSAAVWAFETESLSDLSAHADAIVVAQQTGVRPGRLVGPSSSLSLQFELHDFSVVRIIKGSQGRSITVERVKGAFSMTAPSCDYDGGPYQPQQVYLLFLMRQPDTGWYVLVNQDGRYQLDIAGRLRATGQGTIARALGGLGLLDAVASITASLPR